MPEGMVQLEWPNIWQGLNLEGDGKHIPAESWAVCTNFFYLDPQTLRGRGGIRQTYTGSGQVCAMYYWDYEDTLYWATTSNNLYKGGTLVSGPAENVTSMVSFGVGATPKLIVAEAKDAQDHTLHTYDGTTYATLTGTDVPTAERLLVKDGKLWATCDTAFPSRVYYSKGGDEETWTTAYPDAGAFDVAPTADGDIVDWIDAFGALYIFKQRGVYRVIGEPPDYRVYRIGSADGVIAGTVADVGKGILFCTSRGVFVVDPSGEVGTPNLAQRVYQNIDGELETASAAYCPEAGAYIISSSGSKYMWVCNLNNRPDVWTHWYFGTTNMSCVYNGNGLWIGGTNGKVYSYDHDNEEDNTGSNSDVTPLQLVTADWDMGSLVNRKAFYYLDGRLNLQENAACRVRTWKDGGHATAITDDSLAAGARNMIRTGYNVERLSVQLDYGTLTGIPGFAGLRLYVKKLGAIK